MMADDRKFGFIGSGNIVQAIISGAIKAGNVKATHIKTSAPSKRNFGKIQDLAVSTTHSNTEVTEYSDILFLACNPYHIEAVAKEISSKISHRHLVVSCAGGFSMKDLEINFPPATRMIRIIPNVACSVQNGGVVVVQGTYATREDVETVRMLFKGVAKCFEVPDSLADPASGVLGCGIAMMSLVVEGLSDGGVMMGLSRQDSIQMAAQVMIGTGKLVQETEKHPAEIKDSCCSPNGSSIRGVQALENGGLRASLINAVEATVNRAAAMGPK